MSNLKDILDKVDKELEETNRKLNRLIRLLGKIEGRLETLGETFNKVYHYVQAALIIYTALDLKSNSTISIPDDDTKRKILPLLRRVFRSVQIEETGLITFGIGPKRPGTDKEMGIFYGYHSKERKYFHEEEEKFEDDVIKNIEKAVKKSKNFDELLKNLGDYCHILAWGADHVFYPHLDDKEYLEFCKERSLELKRISKELWKGVIWYVLYNIANTFWYTKSLSALPACYVKLLEILATYKPQLKDPYEIAINVLKQKMRESCSETGHCC